MLSFILLIGPLVTIHELGHFIVAKLTGVRVLVFSLGFGPKLFGFRRGETEYRISALPLGGYVRMYGDDVTADVPEDQRSYAFLEKPYWQKVAIAVAGPATNLALPLFLFFFLALGEKNVVDPVVGTVLAGQPAEQAGLRAGDRIVAVDDTPIAEFDDLQREIGARPNTPTRLTVERPVGGQTGGKTERVTLQATPSSQANPNPTRSGPVGRLGFLPSHPLPLVAVAVDSPAWQAGLRDGDRVVSVDGAAIADRTALLAALDAAAADGAATGAAQDVVVVVERAPAPPPAKDAAAKEKTDDDKAAPAVPAATGPTTLTLTIAGRRAPPAPSDAPCLDGPCDLVVADAPPAAAVPAQQPSLADLRFAVLSDEVQGPVLQSLERTAAAVVDAVAAQARRRGLAPLEATIVAVAADSPAASKGLKPDAQRVVAVDGAPVSLALEVEGALQRDPEGIHVLGLVDDDGRGSTFLLRLQKSTARGAMGKTTGVALRTDLGGVATSSRTLSLGQALAESVNDTGEAIADVAGGMRMLATGKVGLDQIGGPVAIAQVAGEAREAGWRYFLTMMCLFSVNLGLLNLLPVPVLDGGHILLFSVEAVRRKKLSVQARMRATQVGLLFVGALMSIALFNDYLSLF